jgi:hypothetical protein
MTRHGQGVDSTELPAPPASTRWRGPETEAENDVGLSPPYSPGLRPGGAEAQAVAAEPDGTSFSFGAAEPEAAQPEAVEVAGAAGTPEPEPDEAVEEPFLFDDEAPGGWSPYAEEPGAEESVAEAEESDAEEPFPFEADPGVDWSPYHDPNAEIDEPVAESEVVAETDEVVAETDEVVAETDEAVAETDEAAAGVEEGGWTPYGEDRDAEEREEPVAEPVQEAVLAAGEPSGWDVSGEAVEPGGRPDAGTADVAERLEWLAGQLRREGAGAARAGMASEDPVTALLATVIASYLAGRGSG